MAPRPTPEAWKTLLERAGVASPHALAVKTGKSTSTIARLVHGEGTPDVETVRAVADLLTGGDTDAIWSLTGTGLRDVGDWTPPDSASLLDARQRRAIEELIRSMTQPRERAGDGDAERDTRRAAPISADEAIEGAEREAAETGETVDDVLVRWRRNKRKSRSGQKSTNRRRGGV